MTKIAAIDFETANNRANSACQIGIVVMENFQIIEERCWLLRPPELYFSPFCVRVHGITARDCIDAPAWPDVWPEIESMVRDSVLLGHNVGFDARVFEATCNHFGIEFDPLDLLCSRVVAKRTWPNLPGHGLANVAKHLQIQFKHHDALEDAKASAQVLDHAANLTESTNLEELEVSLGLIRGSLRVGSVKVPKTVRIRRAKATDCESELTGQSQFLKGASKPQPSVYAKNGLPIVVSDKARKALLLSKKILAAAKPFKPLQGKHMVLVHSILDLDHDDAINFLQDLGATVYSQINLKTQIVILGSPPRASRQPDLFASTVREDLASLDTEIEEAPTRILEDIEKRQSLGQQIRTISQRQLLALIPSASELVRGE